MAFLEETKGNNGCGKTAKRGSKRPLAIELTMDEEKEETMGGMKVEKEDKELGVNEIIENISAGDKRQKALIKKILNDSESLLAQANRSQLCRLLWSTSTISTSEGQRLASIVLLRLGVKQATTLIKKRLIRDIDIKPQDCQNYGNVMLKAYRLAIASDKENHEWDGSTGPRTREVIDAFSEMAEGAIRIPGGLGERFHAILMPSIDIADRRKYDSLINQYLQPVLWRNIKAPHDQVRHAACMLLLRCFPIVGGGGGDTEDQISLGQQLELMHEMLRDECTQTRVDASRKILRVLSHYYSIIPLQWIRKLMDQIVNVNSFDSIPAVRAAVLEGFSSLVPVSEALNVVDCALKSMLPRLIDDRSEKVRLAAVRLLLLLRGHRFIKYFDVVPMENIMTRLECESSEAIRKEIVKLVHTSFFPLKATADERNQRAVRLIGFGRQAALSFHRLIYPLHLVTLEDAIHCIRNITIAIYKNWRHGVPENSGMASVEEDMTSDFNTSMNTTTATVSAFVEEESVFRRDKVLLECAVVLWASIAKELKKKENEAAARQVEKLMSKIFTKMFANFRQTSLLGTVMCIGSLLPSNLLEEYSIQILQILKEKSVEDDILDPYLEAGASWRIEELMQIIRDGLNELPSVLPTVAFSSKSSSSLRSPVKKRQRTTQLSAAERVKQALHYLKYSLSSQSISAKLMSECRIQLEECFEVLSHVHEVVDTYLESIDNDHQESNSLTGEDILSLYESATVLSVLLVEMPTSSSSSHYGRAASVGSAAVAAEGETEDGEMTSASPYSIFFFSSIHFLEQSLLTRIGMCSSVEGNKEQLQIRLAKMTLQQVETVLTACSRPPHTPTAAAMADVIRRLTAPSGTSSEDEGMGENSFSRRSSIASSMGSLIAPDLPQKSYIERLSAMISALLHTRTPISLLKSTLRVHELIMGMDSEEGEEARAQSYDVVRAAIAIVKRTAENPFDGEELRSVMGLKGDVDAILAYTKVAIAKNLDGPDSFPYTHLMGVVRANCLQRMMKDIDERGVEDVTDHTYDLPQLIELLLHRFVFRHDNMFSHFRSHMVQFALCFDPANTEFVEGEEEGMEEEEETEEERRERLERMRQGNFKRFVVGCQLLRLSAPEIRKAVIKEKRNEKARRSIQSDIDVSSLLAHLDKWKMAINMDEGTETILREMIGPK